MNVINLSLGEPEVDPSRDFVVHAIDAARGRRGRARDRGRQRVRRSSGTARSARPATHRTRSRSPRRRQRHVIADFSSAGPTPVSLQLKPDVTAPGVAITSSLPANQGGPFGQLMRDEHGDAPRRRRRRAAAWSAIRRGRSPRSSRRSSRPATPVTSRAATRCSRLARGRRPDRPRPSRRTRSSSPRRPRSRSAARNGGTR